MQNFGKAVVKARYVILVVAFLLLIPSLIGYKATRINYDMLTYLPSTIDTMKGQKILEDDFGTGAISMVIVEGKSDKEVVALKKKIEKVDHVKKVLWYDSFADISVPKELLPKKLIPVVIARAGIPPHLKCNALNAEQRRALLDVIKGFKVGIHSFRPINEAIVTHGGVDVKDIDPRTMQSKLIKGLYFAGEVLDLDAYTGGFNLQIAYSTGRLAGKSAAKV